MHFASVISLALAAAPVAVSAAADLGFAIGTKRPDGSCKKTADYETDFDTLKEHSTKVRGYDATDCNFAQEILPAAKKKGFQVILGIWADTDTQFSRGKAAVEQYSSEFPEQVYAVTVGSETLYRGNFTGDELVEKMAEVKKVIPDVKVGTADSWNKYADGTADPVIRAADILLCNAFGYWQGQEINNASATFFDDIMQALDRVQLIRGDDNGVEFVVGETGWLTGGGTYGSAVPSVKNAEQFWKQGICGMRAWDIPVYAFEAFDEPWKPVSIGENGEAKDETQWGVFTADRAKKYDLECPSER